MHYRQKWRYGAFVAAPSAVVLVAADNIAVGAAVVGQVEQQVVSHNTGVAAAMILNIQQSNCKVSKCTSFLSQIYSKYKYKVATCFRFRIIYHIEPVTSVDMRKPWPQLQMDLVGSAIVLVQTSVQEASEGSAASEVTKIYRTTDNRTHKFNTSLNPKHVTCPME